MAHGIPIPDHVVRICMNVIRERMALLPPSPEAVRAILEQDRCDSLVEALVRYGEPSPQELDTAGLDTYERDWLIDIIADHFVGRESPLNMHSQEYTNAFVRDLVRNAAKAGWTIAE